jgi:hypothetical protein
MGAATAPSRIAHRSYLQAVALCLWYDNDSSAPLQVAHPLTVVPSLLGVHGRASVAGGGDSLHQVVANELHGGTCGHVVYALVPCTASDDLTAMEVAAACDEITDSQCPTSSLH